MLLRELERLGERRPVQLSCLALSTCGFTIDEAAAELDLRPRQVRRYLQRARESLGAFCDEAGLRSVMPPALLAGGLAHGRHGGAPEVVAPIADAGTDGMARAGAAGWHWLHYRFDQVTLVMKAASAGVGVLLLLAGIGTGAKLTGFLSERPAAAPPERAAAHAPARSAAPRTLVVTKDETVGRVSPPRRPARRRRSARPVTVRHAAPAPAPQRSSSFAYRPPATHRSAPVAAPSHPTVLRPRPSASGGCRDISCAVAP